jgi:nitric oxide reductase activation protein
MSHASCRASDVSGDVLPAEMVELIERIQAQPPEVRAELEPLMENVLEQVRFRSRILTVARDGLERLRLDLELARFDLDATRREREDLRRLLRDQR